MRRFRYAIVAVVIFADQIVKFLVRNGMKVGDSIPVIDNFFSITYVTNTGGAMSSFEGNIFLLIAIPIVAVIFAAVYIEKHHRIQNMLLLSVLLIIAGGVGNLIDRIMFGFVTDFLDFTSLPFWNWVFNIADIAICLGCFLLIIYVLFLDKSQEKSEDGNAAAK